MGLSLKPMPKGESLFMKGEIIMLKNYVPRESRIIEEHSLIFFYDDNGGFSFPCDENGNVALSEMTDCAVANLEDCKKHPERFQYFNKVRTWRRRVSDLAHGTCECGAEVYLYNQYMGACECDCGRWYNLFGQELIPPERWEENEDPEEYW